MKIKRSSLNFAIDYLLALTFCAMGGLGILLLTAVPPTRLLRDSGIADQRVLLWGLDRHQWGFIHLMLALLFMVLLLAHIYFHWPQISCLYQRWTKGNTARRVVTGPLFILLCLLLLGIPCLLKPTLQEAEVMAMTASGNFNQQQNSGEEPAHIDTYNNQKEKVSTDGIRKREGVPHMISSKRKNKEDRKPVNQRHH